MAKPSTDDLIHTVVKQLAELGVIEIPHVFLVPTDQMHELILVAMRVVKEDSLSKGLHVVFVETITALLENSKALTAEQMNTVTTALDLSEKETRWNEQSNQGWYEFI